MVKTTSHTFHTLYPLQRYLLPVGSTCCFADTRGSGVAGGLIARLLISSEGGTDVESEISMELSPRLLGDAVCFWAWKAYQAYLLQGMIWEIPAIYDTWMFHVWWNRSNMILFDNVSSEFIDFLNMSLFISNTFCMTTQVYSTTLSSHCNVALTWKWCRSLHFRWFVSAFYVWTGYDGSQILRRSSWESRTSLDRMAGVWAGHCQLAFRTWHRTNSFMAKTFWSFEYLWVFVFWKWLFDYFHQQCPTGLRHFRKINAA